MVFQSRSASIRRRRITLSRQGTGDLDAGLESSEDFEPESSEWDDAPPPAAIEPSPVIAATTAAPEVPPSAPPEIAEPATQFIQEELPLRIQESNEFEEDWRAVSLFLARPRPVAWLFAGSRPGAMDDQTTSIPGEEFGRLWRSTSRRHTDVIIDATWPGSSLSHLWSNLSERVLWFRPDVVFLFLGDLDSRAGMSHLSKFERQLEATITRLQKERILPVLIAVTETFDVDDIDQQIYREAIVAVGKERDIPVMISSRAQDVPESLCNQLLSLVREHASVAG